MCGRFALIAQRQAVADQFGASVTRSNELLADWDWPGDANIVPTATIPVIALNGQGETTLVPMRWGLHPSWRKEAPEGRPLFNARSETAGEKPSFRTAWRRRRCLVPANGWYEWERGEDGEKTPYFIHQADRELFAFAGLWEQWSPPDGDGMTLLSTTILTTAALGEIKHIHHRMPVRMARGDWAAWLDADQKAGPIVERNRTADGLLMHEVGDAVNSGRAHGEHLMEPVG